MKPHSPYEANLEPNDVNCVPLSPVSFLGRAAGVHPDGVAIVYRDYALTWRDLELRCRRFADALGKIGVGKDDTVAIVAPNIPAFVEAHFAVPMAGAVLNSLNIRLDARAIAFQLEHGAAKVVLVDPEFAPVVAQALELLVEKPFVIDIADAMAPANAPIGIIDYESFVACGDANAPGKSPQNEWQAISLNYTSGTTGNPKGVIYHHRGAYLNAVGNVLVWNMPQHPVYLWTLPMFHCNGWCFPWTIALQSGTNVCLRKITAEAIFEAIEKYGVTHMCGAPVVMNMLLNAQDQEKRKLSKKVQMMTAGSSPPATVILGLEAIGFDVIHVYGLTEVYGPATVCAWQPAWDALSPTEKARMKSLQGVVYPTEEALMVADPASLQPVPKDGETLGEIFLRGNSVMKGYLKNPAATQEAFEGGWFHTGDLGVWHPNGYIEVKDRSKDIIISGGENISTIEVEGVLYEHPAVFEAAVVQKPDEKWGEIPCAFITLKDEASVTSAELIDYCRGRLAKYKIPRQIVFGPLPKTSTGKVQKYLLRELARTEP